MKVSCYFLTQFRSRSRKRLLVSKLSPVTIFRWSKKMESHPLLDAEEDLRKIWSLSSLHQTSSLKILSSLSFRGAAQFAHLMLSNHLLDMSLGKSSPLAWSAWFTSPKTLIKLFSPWSASRKCLARRWPRKTSSPHFEERSKSFIRSSRLMAAFTLQTSLWIKTLWA